MMKRTILIIILIQILGVSYAQIIFPLDTIIIQKKNIGFYCLSDSFTIEDFNSNKKGKSFIYINNIPIDSTGLSAKNIFPISNNNKLFINSFLDSDNQKEKFNYDFKSKKIGTLKCTFEYDYSLKEFYEIELVTLNKVEPNTCEINLFADFYNYVEKETFEGKEYLLGEITEIHFINKNTAIVEICIYGEFENCKELKYFYAHKNGIEEVTNKFHQEFNKEIYQSYFSDIEFTDNRDNYIRENYELSGWKSSDDIKRNRVFDEELNYLSDVLVLKHLRVMGVNIQNNVLKNHFLGSYLNNRTKVIVPYNFNFQLEIAMYKAYNDTILNKEEIQDLGKYELGILRNLLFAKHNYNFNSEFHQAYFNLFAFYNHPDKRKTRTKNVDSLLTDSDKKNIDIIRNLESNLVE